MDGLPGGPTTNEQGEYTATVPYGWSGTVTSTLTMYTLSGEKVTVGAAPISGPLEYFVGAIDEMRIYNRVLSESEINALYGF